MANWFSRLAGQAEPVQRAPEIQQWYDWLQQAYPVESRSIVISTLGRGETFDQMRQAEMARFDGEQAKAVRKVLNETRKEIESGDVPPGCETYLPHAGNGGAYAPFSVVSLMTLRQAYGDLADPLMNDIIPSEKGAWRSMLYRYANVQELSHAVDGLSQNAQAVETNGFELRLRGEAVMEGVSTLDLLQQARTGAFPEPVEPFLDQMQAYHRSALAYGSTWDGGAHIMVDDAIDSARKWAASHPAMHAEMSPRDMMVAGRKLADDLDLPAAGQVQRLQQSVAELSPFVTPKTVPSATSVEALHKLAGITEDPWAKRQLEQAADAVHFLHDSSRRSGVVLQDLCWYDDAKDAEKIDWQLHSFDDDGVSGGSEPKSVTVKLPVINGDIQSAGVCAVPEEAATLPVVRRSKPGIE